MNFFDALKAVLAGSLITKGEWEDPNFYGLLKNGRLTIFLNGRDYDWIITEADMLGEDWIVI